MQQSTENRKRHTYGQTNKQTVNNQRKMDRESSLNIFNTKPNGIINSDNVCMQITMSVQTEKVAHSTVFKFGPVL